MASSVRPLSGLLALDLTRLLPGPYCAWLLRSWGARVVKVEDPHLGDYLREVQPVWFQQLNAGAESVALDLKQPKGRELLLRLVQRADMVLEGFRPGVLERLGLGYEALRAANPRVVLVSLSGFGGDDGRAGHDITYLARSGLLSLMNELPPVQLADLTGGLNAAAGALAALMQARATGQGAHVEASLLDALFGLGSLLGAEAKAGLTPDRSQMPLSGALVCYNTYQTDGGGRVALGALEPKFWAAFCEAVGRPEWVARQMDPALKPAVEELFRSQPLDYWAALARQHDVCLEPVLTVREAVAGRDSFQPVRFGGQRPEGASGPAPERGAHTLEFLRDAGLSQQEIQVLAAEAVVKL